MTPQFYIWMTLTRNLLTKHSVVFVFSFPWLNDYLLSQWLFTKKCGKMMSNVNHFQKVTKKKWSDLDFKYKTSELHITGKVQLGVWSSWSAYKILWVVEERVSKVTASQTLQPILQVEFGTLERDWLYNWYFLNITWFCTWILNYIFGDTMIFFI